MSDHGDEEHPQVHRSEGGPRPADGLRAPGLYKSYDPRAKLIKKVADEVFEQTGLNPKLEIALD